MGFAGSETRFQRHHAHYILGESCIGFNFNNQNRSELDRLDLMDKQGLLFEKNVVEWLY